MSTRSPRSSVPNSYLVSTRIRPRFAAVSCPCMKSLVTVSFTSSNNFCVRNPSFRRALFCIFLQPLHSDRHCEHLIRDDCFRLLEPPRAHLIENLPFPRNMRDNAIERGVSIGRNQNQFVSLIVNITDLAGLLLSEVPRVGFLEYVHCVASLVGAGKE